MIISVTFPSAEMRALLARYGRTWRSAALGRACRALERLLDIVLEPLAAQRPAPHIPGSDHGKFM